MDIDAFLERWTTADTSEQANSQSFLRELCDVLGVPHPGTGNSGDYCFERRVKRIDAMGQPLPDGRIDLYKKSCFVLESKQLDKKTRANAAQHGDAMARAKVQAEGYAKSLESEWPPFLIIVDVGYAIELFADFTGTGKRYLPFRDAATARILLPQLKDAKVRETLKTLWTDPRSLDPSLHQQAVTKRVSENLAHIARSLEKEGKPAQGVASFLMRCIFTMFAEDVRLIPGQTVVSR